MGSQSDNGDWPFDGGSPDELPDLPEEWGVIVIPDDLSELADEVEAIRAELRQAERRTRWQRFTARPAMQRLRRAAVAAVKAPVLIVSMAVLVTVASLFASAWPGPPRSPAAQRTPGSSGDRPDTLPALELENGNARPTPLLEKLPAVVLITDGCDCARLIADTTAAVRPTVAVLIVTSGVPASAAKTPPTGATPQAQGKTVRALRDPTGSLRTSLDLGKPDGAAAAVLVDATGQIVTLIPSARSVEQFRLDLAKL